MRLRAIRTPLTAIALVGALFGGVGVASAGPVAHPNVVIEDPVNFTPQVMADAQFHTPVAYAVEQLGNTMYVGGKFNVVANGNRTITYPRQNLMAFDATTGAMRDFSPDVDGEVWAIEASSDAIYIGGKFKTIDGAPRATIAKLDPVTGALDPNFVPTIKSGRVSEIKLVNNRLIVGGSFSKKLTALNPLTGKALTYIDISVTGSLPGSTDKIEVFKFAVNPAGTRLVGVGNFIQVNGVDRRRAFMLDLGDTSASLSSWYYAPLANNCRATTGFRVAYLKDVDFSPDGSYFGFTSTGYVPFDGGVGRDLCDSASRFETNILNPVRPTWINYTGGDTLHSLEITGSAIYVQGHSRWLDNPLGRDSAGPGAVSRPGGGSIDPVTGKANSWDPIQNNGKGGYNYLATDTGLWIARDGKFFGGEYHHGVVFVPLP